MTKNVVLEVAEVVYIKGRCDISVRVRVIGGVWKDEKEFADPKTGVRWKVSGISTTGAPGGETQLVGLTSHGTGKRVEPGDRLVAI